MWWETGEIIEEGITSSSNSNKINIELSWLGNGSEERRVGKEC